MPHPTYVLEAWHDVLICIACYAALLPLSMPSLLDECMSLEPLHKTLILSNVTLAQGMRRDLCVTFVFIHDEKILSLNAYDVLHRAKTTQSLSRVTLSAFKRNATRLAHRPVSNST